MGYPGRWWCHHLWRCSRNIWTWHSVLWFGWQGGDWSQVELDDFRGIFQPKWGCDYIKIKPVFCWRSNWIRGTVRPSHTEAGALIAHSHVPCANLPLHNPLLVCWGGINRKGCCWLCLEELSQPFCLLPVTPGRVLHWSRRAAWAQCGLSALLICAVCAPERSCSGSLQTPRWCGGWSKREGACQQNWICHLMSAEASQEAGLCYFREGFSGIKFRDILICICGGSRTSYCCLPWVFVSVSHVDLILQSRLGQCLRTLWHKKREFVFSERIHSLCFIFFLYGAAFKCNSSAAIKISELLLQFRKATLKCVYIFQGSASLYMVMGQCLVSAAR